MTTTNRFPLHRNNTALPMVLLLAVVALLQSNGLVLGFSVALPAIRHSRTTSSTTGTSTPPQYSSQRNASPSLVLLQMGLFDGMKEAFSAPALERTTIDAERETPIDRWMGWSVAKENTNNSEGGTAMAVAQTVPADFVDAMDASNYVTVELSKPMGIVFEENDADTGGIFVHSLKAGGAAEQLSSQTNNVQTGDQLVAVSQQNVAGLAFDEALGAIQTAPGDSLKLVLFRGTAVQLYGPTGASQEWLEEFATGKAATTKPVQQTITLNENYNAGGD